MKLMQLLTVVSSVMVFALTGCYTVVWTPDKGLESLDSGYEYTDSDTNEVFLNNPNVTNNYYYGNGQQDMSLAGGPGYHPSFDPCWCVYPVSTSWWGSLPVAKTTGNRDTDRLRNTLDAGRSPAPGNGPGGISGSGVSRSGNSSGTPTPGKSRTPRPGKAPVVTPPPAPAPKPTPAAKPVNDSDGGKSGSSGNSNSKSSTRNSGEGRR